MIADIGEANKSAAERANLQRDVTDRSSSHPLDQWRGLALVLVLAGHAFHETGRVEGLGRVGVNLFFFISGILVFRSLARHRDPDHWHRTKSFWWRRLGRLYPAMLAYILVMLIAEYWLQRIPGQPRGTDYHRFLDCLPSALFYYSNYRLALPSLGHLWSVACEMQFYLVAPLIFTLGGRDPRRAFPLYGFILFLLMGLGMLQPFLPLAWAPKYGFQFAVWPMMLGFCCEFKRSWLTFFPPKTAHFLYWITIGICLATAPAMLLGFHSTTPTVAAGALLLVPCFLAYASGWPISTRFGGAALMWLGKRTYSIYLWQQVFTICFFLPVAWWPLGAAVSIPVGALWFNLFEKPFLSGDRKSHLATP